jgi:ABC-type uncharacterized transport system substrate-binding protein
MMSRNACFIPLLLAGIVGLAGAPASAAEFKVLVVMSYEEQNPWVKEIREGVDSVLGASSEITYFYMDTKTNREGGAKKAEEAYALFQQLQPQGVIAADDDAQAMFVVPFLKNRVDTPVMFNGVNADAERYGFPATNVSGVLERGHIRESLAFIKQLLPSVRTACFITNNVPAGIALRAQVDAEKNSYPMKVNAFHLVGSVGELEALGTTLRTACDTLFVDSLEGIRSEAGPLNNSDVLKVISKVYRGPILGGNRYQVEQGAWAAVVKTGQEQGETSAGMLLQAMRGTPVEKIPVARNSKGQRVINATVIESRGVPLRPIVLRGATLVRQQP